MALGSYVLVFVAGLIMALGTGLGTVPLFFLEDVGDRLNVGLWGFAGGLMASASVFGLLYEAWKEDTTLLMGGAGVVGGIVLVIAAHRLIGRLDVDPDAHDIAEGDFATLANIFFVLLVHSFPEGVAVGVSFAALNGSSGVHLLGFTVPVLAIVITLTLAIHNMPEGVTVAVPLLGEESYGKLRTFGAAVFTSVPQPIGAVVAFYFVNLARRFLGFGYGFAAGAMLLLVAQDVLPEGLEAGEALPNPRVVLGSGFAVGVIAMVPLLFVL